MRIFGAQFLKTKKNMVRIFELDRINNRLVWVKRCSRYKYIYIPFTDIEDEELRNVYVLENKKIQTSKREFTRVYLIFCDSDLDSKPIDLIERFKGENDVFSS